MTPQLSELRKLISERAERYVVIQIYVLKEEYRKLRGFKPSPFHLQQIKKHKGKIKSITSQIRHLRKKGFKMSTIDLIYKTVQASGNAAEISTIQRITGLNRNQILVNTERTLRLDKPSKSSDIIHCVESPQLPEIWDDVIYDARDIETIEQELMYYIFHKEVNPTAEQFQLHLIREGRYNMYRFNWDSKDSYKSAKKKVMRLLRDCKLTEL